MGEIGNDFLDQLPGALADRYTIEREIGRGGMALVFLARDLRHDRPVAIKVLRPEFSATLMARRFFDEIRHASKLQHPGILPIHESGSAADLLFYTMPYVPGGTLRDRISHERQLPISDVVRLTREIADAVAYANAQGIVHRDIKPENVLLSDGHAMIADFGIARAINEAGGERLTSSGLLVGTPEYMSPEQSSKDGVVDARSDVYSLACVVYEMLAGEPPFTGSTSQVVISRQMQEAPRSLRVIRPSVSKGLEGAIETALAKVPADRCRTATEFADALEKGCASPRTRAARLRWAIVGTAVAAAVGVGVWLTPFRPPLTLDANKVVVFPLPEMGADRGEAGSGEEIALMIGSALEQTEPLKWIDGWTWLDAAQRKDAILVSGEVERRIARERNARFFVDGSLVGRMDSATVVLRLNDAVGDSVVVQVSVEGLADRPSLTQLGLRAVVQILPYLVAPGRAPDLRGFSDRRPAAVANWLQGEREYRQSHFVRALSYYERALGLDSGFSWAALKAAQATTWTFRGGDAARFVTLALNLEAALPRKYAEFAHGLKAHLNAEADSAAAAFGRAIALDTAWGEAWAALGETYYHLLPRGVSLDSLAEAAFETARRLDPEFIPPLFHLTELALRAGRPERAESLAAGFNRAIPDSTRIIELGVAVRCVRDGVDRLPWDQIAREHPMELVRASRTLAVVARQYACAKQGFRAIAASPKAPYNGRWGAVFGLQSILVAEGKYDSARAVVDAAVAAGLSKARAFYIIDAAVGAGMDDRAAEVIASVGERYRELPNYRLWYQGVWQMHRGDTARFAAIAAAMSANARKTGDREDRFLARATAADRAWLAGDTRRALSLLSDLTSEGSPDDITWGLWQPLAAERLELAHLLVAKREFAQAIGVASAFDHPQPLIYLLYLPASLVLRARAASALGRADLASAYRARLSQLGRVDLIASLR
jgi:hypothetical protein